MPTDPESNPTLARLLTHDFVLPADIPADCPLVRPEVGTTTVSSTSLRELRLRRGLTQVAVAERMGIQQAAVSKFESRNLDRAKTAVLDRYVAALGGKLVLIVKFPGTGVEVTLDLEQP